VTNSEKCVKQTRYEFETADGKVLNVGGKQVHFAAPPPSNPKKATIALKDLDKAFQ